MMTPFRVYTPSQTDDGEGGTEDSQGTLRTVFGTIQVHDDGTALVVGINEEVSIEDIVLVEEED